MKSLSPQKERIVKILRDLKYHCGSEWLSGIKDDRIRISELNRGYMKERGYEIVGDPCKGLACGNKKCPLYMRKAQKVSLPTAPQNKPTPNLVARSQEMVRLFDLGKPASQIFSV